MPAPLIALGIMAGVQLYQSYQQADSIDKQNELNEYIRNINEEFIELDAVNAEREGYAESAYYQNTIAQVEAQQKALFASKGVDFNFGTAREIREETSLNGFLNTIDIQANARAKALGIRNQGVNLRLNGQMQTLQSELSAQSTRNAGVINAGGTMLAGYKAS